MNDEDIEARLARWRPAQPPSELKRRLRAAVPPPQAAWTPRRWAARWFGGWSWRPWPLAYAGLLTAWALILVLRLLTHASPKCTAPMTAAQTDNLPADAASFAGTMAAEHTGFLARNRLDQL